ncbi:MAG: N-acetylmuramoyl-L-alanine amidase [Clostridia bacterium]|nr:N-acetylmuramoyl-L-alanine amidase [Clostridia bacterium]
MLKRGFAVFLSALILAVGLYIGVKLDQGYIQTSGSYSTQPTIIIDAGHGGFDGGAVAEDGTVEKNINLNISLIISKLLKQSGFCVIMTRQADVSTDDNEASENAFNKRNDLKNRLQLMQDYPDAVFVSIHLNKFTTSSAFGSQVFYSDNDKAKALGDYIQHSIVGLIQHDNMRVNKKATSSTYLLHNATIPAVLVECGFLSNREELQKLKDTKYQNQMAFSVYCGILEYFRSIKGI